MNLYEQALWAEYAARVFETVNKEFDEAFGDEFLCAIAMDFHGNDRCACVTVRSLQLFNAVPGEAYVHQIVDNRPDDLPPFYCVYRYHDGILFKIYIDVKDGALGAVKGLRTKEDDE